MTYKNDFGSGPTTLDSVKNLQGSFHLVQETQSFRDVQVRGMSQMGMRKDGESVVPEHAMQRRQEPNIKIYKTRISCHIQSRLTKKALIFSSSISHTLSRARLYK